MEETTQEERIKCNRCKVNLLLKNFTVKRDGVLYKSCETCREKTKNYKKSKCPHNRQKRDCKDCGGKGICEHSRKKRDCKDCDGSQICKHNKRKRVCKDCGGSQICEHNKRKSRCKDCMTQDERIEFIIKTMVSSSRTSDKEKDRYDANNFIDKPFLEGLFEDSNTCHYCDIPFTYNEYIGTFVTIERLDNSIGHIKSNCVLACWSCNNRHQSKI